MFKKLALGISPMYGMERREWGEEGQIVVRIPPDWEKGGSREERMELG